MDEQELWARCLKQNSNNNINTHTIYVNNSETSQKKACLLYISGNVATLLPSRNAECSSGVLEKPFDTEILVQEETQMKVKSVRFVSWCLPRIQTNQPMDE